PWIEQMRLNARRRLIDRIQVRLDKIKRARHAVTMHSVYENCRIATVSQSVSEVETTDAEIDSADTRRHVPTRIAPHHFDSERIIAEEDVADPRDQDPRRRHGVSPCFKGSTSSTPKKKRCPGCFCRPNSWPGSSFTTTARYTRPSKSHSIDSMI